MIKEIEDNDVFEAIQLMKKYLNDIKELGGFNYNEAAWIKFFITIVEEQNKSNPHYIAIGSYKDNKLNGFLTATSYINYYDNIYLITLLLGVHLPLFLGIFSLIKINRSKNNYTNLSQLFKGITIIGLFIIFISELNKKLIL